MQDSLILTMKYMRMLVVYQFALVLPWGALQRNWCFQQHLTVSCMQSFLLGEEEFTAKLISAATSPYDFIGRSSPINFFPGNPHQCYSIPIVNDCVPENTEAFIVALSISHSISFSTSAVFIHNIRSK